MSFSLLDSDDVMSSKGSHTNYFREQLDKKQEVGTAVKRCLQQIKSPEEAQSHEAAFQEDNHYNRILSAKFTSTTTSSAPSSEIRKVRAKQAVARLKLKQLEHQQELVMKEVEMKMKREMVEVQNEIDQADLEAEIYEQNTEDNEEECNITPSIPATSDRLVLPIPNIEYCSRIPPIDLGNDRSDLKNLATTIRQGFVLPKPELPKFDGNPLQYWSFMRAFENNIERNTSDENEKLLYLMQYCIGDAATSFVKSVTDGASIKPADRVELLAFADQLRHCENTLKAIGYLDEINSADNLKRIVQRLPYHLRVKWLDKAQALLEAGERPRLHHISQFVMAGAKTANNPVFAGILFDERNQNRNKVFQQKPEQKSNFNIRAEEDGEKLPNRDEIVVPKPKENYAKTECPSCGGWHSLTNANYLRRNLMWRK
ncbi:Hypothetical predicted protein [Paramuricea clavata]|uniref:Uncharacterized protein n=1 Tax=Paramuricea clavata TaxID=317549 RepID=A0A7D9E6U4_PARCT|nr:Hypothetical predicted protein [Paramuricea clavata]